MKHHLSNDKLKKKSLKRRIQKMMNFTNGFIALLTCVIVFYLVTYIVSYLGTNLILHTAKQLSHMIENNNDLSYIFDADISSDEIDYEHLKSVVTDMIETSSTNNGNYIFPNEVRYEVWIYDTCVYSSYDNISATDKFSRIPKDRLPSIVYDVKSSNGNVVGKVITRPNPSTIIGIYIAEFSLGIFLILSNVFVVKMVSKILSKVVVNPLMALNNEMNKVLDNDVSYDGLGTISIKKPVAEVNLLMDSTNNIIKKMSEYSALLSSQKDELEVQNEELEAQRNELEAQNEELEAQRIELESHKEELEAQRDELSIKNKALIEHENALKAINTAYMNRTMKLQNLLNSIGQGFLTVNKELLINPEYSSECEKMLCTPTITNLIGKPITDVLFTDDNENFVNDVLKKVFSCNQNQKELYLSLLPDEIYRNDRILNIQYKLACDDQQSEQLLVILTDITQTRELEQLMDEERNNLKMIVKVLLNREECIGIINDYKNFAKNDIKITDDNTDLLREIHTYKGSFSQYHMDRTAHFLNELESKIQAKDLGSSFVITNSEFMEPLEMDISIIQSYVGKDYLFREDYYRINEDKLIDLERRIKEILPSSECSKILPLISSLRHKSVKILLKTYPDYSLMLAQRLGKEIKPFTITGDDIYLNPDLYDDVFKNLVHVFRNAIDHGIEATDKRLECGKDELATVTCNITDLETGFEITISDDGCGLQEGKILQAALRNQIIDENQVVNLSKEDIHQLIFMDGLTTNEETTMISGRGYGLSSLRSAVYSIGGHIQILSEEGQGTTYKIWLPYFDYTLEKR